MKSFGPKLLLFIALITAVLATTACRSSGSREFKPGKGWVPN